MQKKCSAPKPHHHSPAELTPNPRKIVLVIDDYEDLETIFEAGLRAFMPGYRMIFTASLEAAEEALRTHGNEMALIISDGILKGGLVWNEKFDNLHVNKDAKTAAHVMHAMARNGVTAPFFLVSGSVNKILPELPQPPTASFSKGRAGVKEIFDKARHVLELPT